MICAGSPGKDACKVLKNNVCVKKKTSLQYFILPATAIHRGNIEFFSKQFFTFTL